MDQTIHKKTIELKPMKGVKLLTNIYLCRIAIKNLNKPFVIKMNGTICGKSDANYTIKFGKDYFQHSIINFKNHNDLQQLFSNTLGTPISEDNEVEFGYPTGRIDCVSLTLENGEEIETPCEIALDGYTHTSAISGWKPITQIMNYRPGKFYKIDEGTNDMAIVSLKAPFKITGFCSSFEKSSQRYVKDGKLDFTPLTMENKKCTEECAKIVGLRNGNLDYAYVIFDDKENQVPPCFSKIPITVSIEYTELKYGIPMQIGNTPVENKIIEHL